MYLLARRDTVIKDQHDWARTGPYNGAAPDPLRPAGSVPGEQIRPRSLTPACEWQQQASGRTGVSVLSSAGVRRQRARAVILGRGRETGSASTDLPRGPRDIYVGPRCSQKKLLRVKEPYLWRGWTRCSASARSHRAGILCLARRNQWGFWPSP